MTDAGAFWDRRFTEHAWPVDPDELLVARVDPLPPGRAVDVGSGPGRNSLWLARRGWTVTAVDASAVGLRQARAQADAEGLALQTEQVDVLAWSPPASTYDLVVLANLHLPPEQLADLLNRLTEVLVPGGHLFVVGHDLANLGRHGPADPELLLTVERLTALLPTELVDASVEQVSRRRDDGGGDGQDDVAVVAWAQRGAVRP